ncbi:MAG TPA: hypothetical protein VNU97_16220 [Rhizomicrobium sp.]|jgi:hypothetical protein|nr:hypothetical protein [Rhizomicrobium sp.]
MDVRLLRALAAALLLAAASSAADAADAAHTYSDTARGFSLTYPDGWRVDPNFADQGYGYAQGETDDVRTGVAFSPTIDLAPGTTLESKELKLVVEAARPGDLCKAAAFLEDPPPDYFTQVMADTPTLASTLAEPGDMYDVEHIVRIVSQTPCIAVQVFLVYAQSRPHDPKPVPQFDRHALLAVLDGIVATMRFAK